MSLRSSVIHEFCGRALFSCPVFMCVLEPCAISSACLVLCWSMVFGSRHSYLEFRFRVGVRTLSLCVLSHCVSVWARVRSVARSSVHVCFVVLWTQFLFLSAACIDGMSCAVWHAACVFHGLGALLS